MALRRSRVVSEVAVAVALVAALVPTRAEWVEHVFSRGLYPALQPWLTGLSNLIPFALFDVLLVVGGGTILVWIVRACAKPRTHGWRTLTRLLLVASALYLIFLFAWGLHYRREGLRGSLVFDQTRVTHAALLRLADRTVAELNALHPTLPEAWPEWGELRGHLSPGFEQARARLGERWPVRLGEPKASLLDLYFKRAAVDGMLNPFFLEVLVNQDVLPFERPFVVSHEWGHLAGRADESEASFVGWMACMHGPRWARYSAWASLYGTILAGLPPDEQAGVGAALAEGPRRDLLALRDRILRQSAPAVRRAGEAVYDRFLKANRLHEGVASYAMVVTLLLGADIEIPPVDGL